VCILVWIGNGFDPADPNRLDEFSLDSLLAVLRRYRQIKADGREVTVVIPNYSNRSVSGCHLGQLMYQQAQASGVAAQDLQLSAVKSFNALTDGMVVAELGKDNPDTDILVFGGLPPVSEYFHLNYQAVARACFGHKLRLRMVPSWDREPDFRSWALYTGLLFFTHLITIGGDLTLFRAWFRFRCWMDRRRTKSFTRTVS